MYFLFMFSKIHLAKKFLSNSNTSYAISIFWFHSPFPSSLKAICKALDLYYLFYSLGQELSWCGASIFVEEERVLR